MKTQLSSIETYGILRDGRNAVSSTVNSTAVSTLEMLESIE